MHTFLWTLSGAMLAFVSCPPACAEGLPVDARRIVSAPTNTAEWLTYGRTYDGQRYAPLELINAQNVQGLGLAWFADLDTHRGQEGTPLVVGGKLYVSTAWSKVRAYDAANGRMLWAFDPQVPGQTAVNACCDVVNRGLATWGRNIYVATLDGRLVALDRDSGRVRWSRVTTDPELPYTITGAPIVVSGKVIIGNGGAEMGVRGYITAYDAVTGRQAWRFYTVPGKPGTNAEPYLRRAEATWHGEWWTYGGGGTVWDSMAYDPELDLLYIGVGNGSPWNQAYRSPGGGDNLYLSSIVALRPATGEYVWHYQETPGETWDYTATQHIVLANLVIDGHTRKVLMQVPKNGFFYVLDRATGELISAKNVVPVNWARSIDLKTGRPVENPEARIDRTGKPALVIPGPGGAHNWQPMAYDPNAGLVFIPTQEAGFPYVPAANWLPAAQGFNTGMDFAAGAMPADTNVRQAILSSVKGALIAWDPVKQEQRWRVDLKGPWNGGVLATAGGLVFEGTASKEFVAYETATGKRLWSVDAQTGVMAAPITYAINGEQYVAVLAGWGGSWALSPGILSEKSGPVRNISRLLVYKLGGTAQLPAEPPFERPALDPPPVTGTAEQIGAGAQAYGRFCGVCHGDAAYGSTVIPDLRRSSLLGDPGGWAAVVAGGALRQHGMVSFTKVLTADQLDSIRQYVVKRSNEDKALGVR